ncbi:paraflagellar rod protein-like protein [Trypanosoma rangeli]|uniref:Paraflagellar rod protein-like protein n=1 Tax=Trypanosoma rangeli TaxID=5698 RepID=A0A422NJR9_TRYRA|nr:paraflagellar rod protein-like protein [Trypanosoma rangeli]RNF05730.1 paraflagellar rod protein-like protein [Trypanosoma rangeli]|eukprot:RNF05730.1 paraflagellar rod protein-like protein [Trypanosoma rangeli]
MAAAAAAATIFQRNKRIYVQEEDKLEGVVSDETFQQKFHQWLDATIAQLDLQFELCEQQLSELQQNVAVESGSYWCSKTIIQHCNLHMSEKRLIVAGIDMEEHATLPDLVNLISSLQQLKGQAFISPKQRRFIEECESELKKVVFESRELVFITNALKTKLRDDGNTRGVFGDLTEFQNTIEDLSPDIDQCEQLLEASIANGEMGLAEDISLRQLEIYERILTLITDQYPIITNYYTESRDSDRRRRWAIFRMADKDITAVIEGKYRQIEACEEDLMKIKEQIENYSNDDSHQRKRYEADRDLSDEFLQKNKNKQQGVWNRVYELYEELRRCQMELTKLARQRRKEIDRRLQMEEHEAGRRSGHEAFLRAAAEHAQRLQGMINNSLAAKELATALNNFVLDGCDSITSKYDKQQNALSEMLRLVQQHHFKRFSDYYIAASRYLYRKERRLEQLEKEIESNEMKKEMLSDRLDTNAKRYADLNNDLLLKRREASQEVLYIRHKLEKADRAIEPTLRSLQFAGVGYVHPRDIVEKVNLNRCSTILDYREFMTPSISYDEKVRMEELITLAELRSSIDVESKERSIQKRLRLPSITKKDYTVLQKRVNALLEKRFDEVEYIAPVAATASRGTAFSDSAGTKDTARQSMTGNMASEAPGNASPAAAVDMVGGTTTIDASLRHSRMEGTVMRALYPYKARAPDELTFEEGDLIVCVNRDQEEGWFKGVCNQRTGLFPIKYAVPVDEFC